MYQKPLMLSCNLLETIDNYIKQKSSEEFLKKLKLFYIVFNNSEQLVQFLESIKRNDDYERQFCINDCRFQGDNCSYYQRVCK